MQKISGVILSAGKGSRIDPFNTQYPKPLLPIGNRPILGHHLEMFHRLGIGPAYIVVGHLMDRIINAFGRHSPEGDDINYVEQDNILGIAHAVGRVEPHLDGPFMLVLGDIFYLAPQMKRMVDRYMQGDVAAVLAVKEETSPEPVKKNFTVEMDDAGFVTRVVEKPRRPSTLLKGCGIYLFGPEVFDAIHRTPRTAMRDEYEITNTLQILIDDGHKVVTESVIDWDLNVTFPVDLLEGNLAYLQQSGRDNLVADGVHLGDEVRLERCVVGAGAHIQGPVHLSDCVVFPNTRVERGGDMDRTLFSGDLVIRC